MSDASSGNSVEAWVLMALVYRDLDDFDYDNALVLAERLYALEKDNEDYRFLYAKCLFVLQDYTASYRVLKNARTIPSLNLFAKSCLELGKLEENVEGRRYIWNEGAQALITALNLYDKTMPNKHFWGDGELEWMDKKRDLQIMLMRFTLSFFRPRQCNNTHACTLQSVIAKANG